MNYLHPERLWWLLVVAVFAAVYIALQFSRPKYAIRFTNLDLLDKVAPSRPDWRRYIPAIGFLTMASLLVFAWADPTSEEAVPRDKSVIVLAIDVSLSMMAQDVSPDRFEAAKEAARDFVEQAPDTAELALVSFHGVAQVRVSPTLDRGEMLRAIDALRLDEATAIGDALRQSVRILEDVELAANGERVPSAIVLMSDGETTAGPGAVIDDAGNLTGFDNSEFIAAAIEIGVSVDTIAFGTPDGTIELDGFDGPIGVGVKEEELREIAAATDGTFYNAATAEELTGIYSDIGTAVGEEIDIVSRSAYFVGWALAVAALTAIASLAWFQRLP